LTFSEKARARILKQGALRLAKARILPFYSSYTDQHKFNMINSKLIQLFLLNLKNQKNGPDIVEKGIL